VDNMRLPPLAPAQPVRSDNAMQTAQTEQSPQSSLRPENARGAEASTAAAADSMEFDSLEAMEAETHARARGDKAKHVRPNGTRQLRMMSERRLLRVYQAIAGRTGNENQTERQLETSAGEILEKTFDGRDIGDVIRGAQRDPLRSFVFLRKLESMIQQRLETEGPRMTAVALESVRAQLSRVSAAIDKLLRTNGKRVRGGLNTAEAFEQFSELVKERDVLRDIYYDVIVMGPSVRETFERLLKAFGAAKFMQSVKTMRNALVDDMKAPFPSANRILLETYYQGLKEAHIIASLIHHTDDLKKHVGSSALESDDGVVDFLTQVLRYTEGPGNARQFKQVCEAVTGKDKEAKDERFAGSVEEKIARHVKAFLLKYVPLELWADNETRDTLLLPRRAASKAAAAA
jgi:type III secretion protein W